MSKKEEAFVMDRFIRNVCEEIGPRLGTYSAEKQAGLKIKGILEQKVDEIVLEDFQCHPTAFLDFTRVAWIIIIIGALFFWWLPLISFALYLYAVSIFLFEQMLLKEYVDFFFPKRTGTNVIGKLKAATGSKQIVICSAHQSRTFWGN